MPGLAIMYRVDHQPMVMATPFSHKPKSNEAYWHPKLMKNMERDKTKEERLRSEGWSVIRLWEHELSDHDVAVLKILQALDRSETA